MVASSGCGLFQKMLTSMDMHPELVKRDEEFPGSHNADIVISTFTRSGQSQHTQKVILTKSSRLPPTIMNLNFVSDVMRRKQYLRR